MQNESPIYIQISDEIIKSIKSGIFQPGDKIPSENELIKKYEVSNTTARKSLLEIELKGWARRVKGRGTFVLNRTENKYLTRTLGSVYSTRIGFDEKLIEEGFKPKNIIVEKMILDAGISAKISGRHYIIEGPVVKIRRLRYADDILMKDEIRYISLKICPGINMLDSKKPYFKIYEEEYNLKLTDIKQTLSTTIFSTKTPDNYFGSKTLLPVFILNSAVSNAEGKVVEIEKSYYRGDKYQFSIISNSEILS